MPHITVPIGTAALSIGSTSLSFIQSHPSFQDFALVVGVGAGIISMIASGFSIIVNIRREFLHVHDHDIALPE